jgi:hypothetical protein
MAANAIPIFLGHDIRVAAPAGLRNTFRLAPHAGHVLACVLTEAPHSPQLIIAMPASLPLPHHSSDN